MDFKVKILIFAVGMKQKSVRITIVIIVILYSIFAFIYENNQFKKNFERFNSTTLKGVLKKVEIVDKGAGIILYNDVKKEYVFYPNDDINKNKIFEEIAKKGDSIVKYAFSDTLILIKKDKAYRFTFEKPGD